MIPGRLKAKGTGKMVVRKPIPKRPKKAVVKTLGDGVKKITYGRPWKIKY